jgi:uncharacterized protein (DUF2237 family)
VYLFRPKPSFVAEYTGTHYVPYAATATTAAYFSAAGSAASMFTPPLPLFPLLPRHRFCFCCCCTTASVSNAIATIISATAAITDKKRVSLQVLWLQQRTVAADTMVSQAG